MDQFYWNKVLITNKSVTLWSCIEGGVGINVLRRDFFKKRAEGGSLINVGWENLQLTY